MDLLVSLTLLMITVYNIILFKMIDVFLEGSKLTNIYKLLGVSFFNSIFVGFSVFSSTASTSSAYIFIGILLSLEFIAFYKDTKIRAFFCAQAVLIHIICLRTLILSIITACIFPEDHYFIEGIDVYDYSTLFILVLTSVACLLCIKFIPQKLIRTILEHEQLLYFMISWSAMFISFLFFSSDTILTDMSLDYIFLYGIGLPICILLNLYLLLFFTVMTSNLYGLKTENAQLIEKMHTDAKYKGIFTKNSAIHYEINLTDNLILTADDNFVQIFGIFIANYDNMRNYIYKHFVNPEDAENYFLLERNKIILAFEQGVTTFSAEYRMIQDNHEYEWMRITLNAFRNDFTDSVNAIVNLVNINDEKAASLSLQFKAERDSLTELYNKGYTKVLIDEYLNKNDSLNCALFIVDIDNFKTINDRLGHGYGDKLLVDLSAALKSLFSDTDVVGRIGGDEFIVFLKDTSSVSEVTTKAKLICEKFHVANYSDYGQVYYVSSSIGIVTFNSSINPQGTTFDAMYKSADIALYKSKEKGKNTYTFYDGGDFSGYTGSR